MMRLGWCDRVERWYYSAYDCYTEYTNAIKYKSSFILQSWLGIKIIEYKVDTYNITKLSKYWCN